MIGAAAPMATPPPRPPTHPLARSIVRLRDGGQRRCTPLKRVGHAVREGVTGGLRTAERTVPTAQHSAPVFVVDSGAGPRVSGLKAEGNLHVRLRRALGAGRHRPCPTEPRAVRRGGLGGRRQVMGGHRAAGDGGGLGSLAPLGRLLPAEGQQRDLRGVQQPRDARDVGAVAVLMEREGRGGWTTGALMEYEGVWGRGGGASFERRGGGGVGSKLGPKSLCTKNGPTRFSLL